jgi:hypothetical protein
LARDGGRHRGVAPALIREWGYANRQREVRERRDRTSSFRRPPPGTERRVGSEASRPIARCRSCPLERRRRLGCPEAPVRRCGSPGRGGSESAPGWHNPSEWGRLRPSSKPGHGAIRSCHRSVTLAPQSSSATRRRSRRRRWVDMPGPCIGHCRSDERDVPARPVSCRDASVRRTSRRTAHLDGQPRRRRRRPRAPPAPIPSHVSAAQGERPMIPE